MKNKKWVIACIHAIENEIVIDEKIYQMFHALSHDYANTPRPSKWLARFQKYDSSLKLSAKILRFFWKFFLGYIFSSIELFRLYLKWMSSEKIKAAQLTYSEYGIGFSDRAYSVIPMAIDREPACWINFPWTHPNGVILTSPCVSFLSLLEFKDFFKTLCKFVILHKKILRDKTLSSHIIQSYVAYRWLLVIAALSKLNADKILIAEHFDRWAILADRVAALKNAEVSLVQHGSLEGLDSSKSQDFLFNFNHKLQNVTHLYVFNSSSERIFLDNILKLSPVLKKKLEVIQFKLKLELTALSDPKISILFVGHTICEAFHFDLYAKLMAKRDVVVYYKPHPLAAPSEWVKKCGWIMVDKGFFPKVNLLVSYPSTLVEEYRSLGINTAMHSLNATNDKVDDFLSSLILEIDKLNI